MNACDNDEKTWNPIFNILTHGEIKWSDLDNDFSWVHVTCADWKSYFSLLDTLKNFKEIRSLKSNGYKKMDIYLMAPDGFYDKIIDLIEAAYGREKVRDSYTFEELHPSDGKLTLKVILQLCINSLGNNVLNDASNAAGNFYQVVKIEKDKKAGIISHIVAVKFEVHAAPEFLTEFGEYVLGFNVCTFNNSSYPDIKWGKGKKANVIRYTYVPGSGMQKGPYPYEDNSNTFVLKSRYFKDKTHLDLLNLTKASKKAATDDTIEDTQRNLEESRSAIVYKVLERLNIEFGDYFGGLSLYKCAAIRFLTKLDESYLEKLTAHFKERTISFKESTRSKKEREMTICIYNLTEAKNQKIIDEFVDAVKNRYGIELTTTKSPRFGMYNIPCLHPKKYYSDKGEKDPHTDHSYTLMQHATVENLEVAIKKYRSDDKRNNTAFEKRVNKWLGEHPGKTRKDYISATNDTKSEANIPMAEVLFEQLYIKEEIENQQMEFYDWRSFNAEGDWQFAIPLTHSVDHKKMLDGFSYFVIHKDGSMEEPVKCDPSDIMAPAEFSTLDDWLKIEFAVVDPNGNVNVVRSTNVSTLPDAAEIKRRIKENKKNNKSDNHGLRSAESKKENLAGCVDIGYIKIADNRWIYYVGQYNNLQQTIANSSVVREIEAVNGSSVFFDKLFHMMSIPFVKHNQNSVIPFPIKYLREWCKKLDYFIDDQDDD